MVAIETAIAVAAAAWCSGCASSKAPASSAPSDALAAEARPRWMGEAIDTHRDFTITVRPTALARDPIWGPLVRRAARVAAAHGPAGEHVGTTTLEALEGSDAITLAMRGNDPLDAVVVLAGVPAAADPSRLVDSDGRPVWEDAHTIARGVTELSPRSAALPSTLLVLPGRTWVVAVGASAIDRTRAAVTRSPPAPYAPSPDEPPVTAHLRGEILDRVRTSARSGLAPIVDGLDEVELALTTGKLGRRVGERTAEARVTAAFVYGDERSAVAGERRGRELVEAFAQRGAHLAWLRDTRIERRERRLDVAVVLPSAWLRDFARAETAPTGQSD
jgi:hypothetical protein